MKVLHLINTLSAGGAELHLLTLCRHLKRLGVDLEVACLRERVKGSRSLWSEFETVNNRAVINLNADSRYNLVFLNRLAGILKKGRPDILHTHLPRADIAGALVARLAGAPVFVCSVHGIYRDRWFGSWAAPLMRGTYQKANAVIAISSAVKDWLNQDLGIVRDKIKVIHYGIDPESFKVARDKKPTSTGRQLGALVVGSIGRLEPGKGFDCLIRAMERVHRILPNASLWIAGHDPLGYRNNLEGLIAKLNMKAQVRLFGFQDDIPSFLHGLDVFAFASRSEGFGQVIIEAMAAGKPVIASKIPPLTEIVIDRETGLLVEPENPGAFADALCWLLRNPEERRRMGSRGKERVARHFSVAKMANETLLLYENLLGSVSQQDFRPKFTREDSAR